MTGGPADPRFERFVAGVKCPQCGALDTTVIRVAAADSDNQDQAPARRCTACGFSGSSERDVESVVRLLDPDALPQEDGDPH